MISLHAVQTMMVSSCDRVLATCGVSLPQVGQGRDFFSGNISNRSSAGDVASVGISDGIGFQDAGDGVERNSRSR
ncbi:MAG: hypothetical protein AUJ19_04290 [Parcubacteria group bacterium CG1_02_58_44]|nr:MAG: hypothetical protein AUJ19_04290 [Parcubacteria group bacterium CG1_02_58_44]